MADATAIIKNVLKICKEEKQTKELALPLDKAVERAAKYTGTSVATVYRASAAPAPTSAPPSRKKRSDSYVLDGFDREIIRRTVHEMVLRGKGLPTARAVLKGVQGKMDFPGKLTFMRQTLNELGFSWTKCGSNRSILMERADVVVARTQFLRNIEKYRDEGRPIIYTDETFIHTSHSLKKCWQSDEFQVRIPFSKGERLIILHAGSAAGFVNGALLMFKAGSASGDYHSEMNSTNFTKWLNERLIPNLPQNSVVVVDNASYHNVQIDRRPTTATRKADVIGWLNRNGIVHDEKLLKAELLDICRRSMVEPRYVLDETLKQHGHTCLRLPQYHAELNAIENIWGIVKGKVAASNVTYKYKDILQLAEAAMDSVTPEEWESCCRHAKEVEGRFQRDDICIEKKLEEFIVYVSDEEGTDTADSQSDYSDTDSAFECC